MSKSADHPSRHADDQGLTHPFAVVTGASSGIGFELAKGLGEHGYDLLVVAEGSGIHEAAKQLAGTGTHATALQADLATASGVEELVDRIDRLRRPVDVLVLNAGIGVGGPFLETSLEAELELIRLNVISVVATSKHLLPRMVAAGQGRVLYTASVASEMPAPFQAVYGASKAFVLSFAEAVRNEIKDSGVTITALQPGATETNFFARAGMLDTRVGSAKKDDPADVARDGLKALFDGDDSVVAGSFLNTVQSVMGHVTPETLKAQLHRKLTEPGSGDIDEAKP
ncbi:MAG: SDR family NAD(P)-dependent oxidoreductase [Gemmatimonadota bacterium]